MVEQQISILEAKKDWKSTIENMLEALIKEKELPENSLYLKRNTRRTGEETTSYSICIYEPEYPATSSKNMNPTRNSIVMNIKEEKGLTLIVSNNSKKEVKVPNGVIEKSIKSDLEKTQIIFKEPNDYMYDYMMDMVDYSLRHYSSKAKNFGCCSLFNKCSDEKKCIHENKLYSWACAYRHHLENGEIFYGKNKNI